MNEKNIAGGCLCGGVKYEIIGKLRDVITCQCEQCRRTSGHFVAATACRKTNFILTEHRTLKWFSAVPGFQRGFCNQCGSSLFFEETSGDRMSIAAGSLDEPHGLKIAAHLFVSEAGD
ncbi:MAG: GFA family protein [Comamonadaceae bacterium]|nr:MAG: GFA family protein [Comamonadaceae bacterium]